MKLRNHPVLWAAIGVVVTILLAAGVVIALQRTGDAKAVSDNAPLIAAVLALGGVFTAQMVSIALEQQRTRETRDLEAQRAGEAALQNYFEQVGKLLIEKPLHRASPGDNLSTVVRAQTLSVLEGLDPDRKRILLLFLYESELIYKDKPVVSLAAANLREANLREANLSRANLGRANLSGADLSEANLREANLSRAYLHQSNLYRGKLSEADLRDAFLSEADLSEANLSGADLSEAYLRGAYLRRTNLRGASLRWTEPPPWSNLTEDLREAGLSKADLTEVDLTEVGLPAAPRMVEKSKVWQLWQIWTANHLRGVSSLEGATMPDGQKYEDWLKNGEGRGRVGENSGHS